MTDAKCQYSALSNASGITARRFLPTSDLLSASANDGVLTSKHLKVHQCVPQLAHHQATQADIHTRGSNSCLQELQQQTARGRSVGINLSLIDYAPLHNCSASALTCVEVQGFQPRIFGSSEGSEHSDISSCSSSMSETCHAEQVSFNEVASSSLISCSSFTSSSSICSNSMPTLGRQIPASWFRASSVLSSAAHATIQQSSSDWLIGTVVCNSSDVASSFSGAAAVLDEPLSCHQVAADADTIVAANDGATMLLLGHCSTSISSSIPFDNGVAGLCTHLAQLGQQEQLMAAALSQGCQLSPMETAMGRQVQADGVAAGGISNLDMNGCRSTTQLIEEGTGGASKSVLVLGMSCSLPQQQLLQQEQQCQQPAMQLLSCSTLLSPAPSAVLAGLVRAANGSSNVSSGLQAFSGTNWSSTHQQSVSRVSNQPGGTAGRLMGMVQSQHSRHQQQQLMYLLD
jgi:hypothetical protein